MSVCLCMCVYLCFSEGGCTRFCVCVCFSVFDFECARFCLVCETFRDLLYMPLVSFQLLFVDHGHSQALGAL